MKLIINKFKKQQMNHTCDKKRLCPECLSTTKLNKLADELYEEIVVKSSTHTRIRNIVDNLAGNVENSGKKHIKTTYMRSKEVLHTCVSPNSFV